MKYIHFTFIVILVLMSIPLSCKQELSMIQTDDGASTSATEMQTKSSQTIDYEAYEIIEAGYIEFVDYQYGISISIDEAAELGYSAEGYRYLESQLMSANERILQDIDRWENDPEVKEWNIIDCTYATADEVESIVELTPIKTRQEQTVTMPGGTISATLGSSGEISIFAPNGMKGVSGYCFNNVALGAVNEVQTNFFGGVFVASRVGNGSISVSIAASNTYGRIKYTTSDSNGGTFSWNGYM